MPSPTYPPGPSQQSEDVREKIADLIPLMERFKQTIAVAVIDGDQEESQRRSELSRYARRFFTTPTIANGLHSALQEIERRSRALMNGRSAAARFLDKESDSAEVVKIIERLREAIAHYQVSESCLVMPSVTHERIDFTTTGDLLPNHQPYRMYFPARLYPSIP